MSNHEQIKTISNLKNVFFVAIALVAGFGLICIGFYVVRGVQLQSEAPFRNPPAIISDDDLLGTWQAKYMEWGTDTITINKDGSFKQKYVDRNVDNGNFEFESVQESWRIEKLSDGRVYLHLQGGKYFLNGVSFAEKIDNGYSLCPDKLPSCENETNIPVYLYDWIGDDFVRTTGELILNVRTTESGEILLLHLWSSSDKGFPLIGGESEIFRRVSAP